MKRSDVAVFCLAAVVFLVGWAAWRHHRGSPLPFQPQSCEDRCFASDPSCAEVVATQGGFPLATLADADRRARCNGICYVLRARNPGSDAACLAQ
jgi:hypothetical protein